MPGVSSWRLRVWLALAGLNIGLVALVHLAAPAQPLYSDRIAYEHVGRTGLAPGCSPAIFCHRFLVPVLLEQIPVPSELRWRTLAAVSQVAAGIAVALASILAAGSWRAGVLASVIAQTSYGFTFTTYDPYTVDPVVLLLAALVALAWLADRPGWALALALPGVFVKQTVALVVLSAGLAALRNRGRRTWWQWVAVAVLACTLLVAFVFGMRAFAGWDYTQSDSANFAGGGWLGIWLRTVDRGAMALHVFAGFGFAWFFAAWGFRTAPRRLRALALGAILPLVALVYVQTPERALGTAFYVVVPLAAVFLQRVPFPLALLSVVANGLLTARVGLSTPWLPPAHLLIPLAGVPALAVAWTYWRSSRQASDQSRSGDTLTPRRPAILP